MWDGENTAVMRAGLAEAKSNLVTVGGAAMVATVDGEQLQLDIAFRDLRLTPGNRMKWNRIESNAFQPALI